MLAHILKVCISDYWEKECLEKIISAILQMFDCVIFCSCV